MKRAKRPTLSQKKRIQQSGLRWTGYSVISDTAAGLEIISKQSGSRWLIDAAGTRTRVRR